MIVRSMDERQLGPSVQEVREDEMDAKWLREPFDLKKANEVCERCKWYVVEGGT